MKLYYDKRAKDPIYYVQHGYRNGKKATTRNVARIGKHSELLKITGDPLAYAREEVARRNEEVGGNKLSIDLKIDFDERLKPGDSIASKGNQLNVGYFILQGIYRIFSARENKRKPAIHAGFASLLLFHLTRTGLYNEKDFLQGGLPDCILK